MAAHPKATFIGQEAGSSIAEKLDNAGFGVVEFGPSPGASAPAPVPESLQEAVAGAAVVFSRNSSIAPFRLAEQIAPMLGKDVLYADMNPGTPSTKKELAALFHDGSFVDVTTPEPSLTSAAKISLEAAGPGAARLVELLAPSGLNLEYVSDVPGEATARRLFRSLLAKGMAGVITDCLWAAETIGMQGWAYQEILQEFDNSSAETATRYLGGNARNAKRQQIEMMDVVAMLNEADYQSPMIASIEFNYGRILHGKRIPFSNRR